MSSDFENTYTRQIELSPVRFGSAWATHAEPLTSHRFAGMKDRKAVTAYLKKGTFKTVMGTWKFNNQVIDQFWTVGQWQNGVFYGVTSTGASGAKPVVAKTGW